MILAGLIGIYVGVGLVFFPVELQAQNGILIAEHPSHLSETRAPGTAILSASMIILISAFRHRWTQMALGLSTLFFLSYGMGRVLSLVLDGMPAEGLFYAMIGELIIGALCLIALLKVNKIPQSAAS